MSKSAKSAKSAKSVKGAKGVQGSLLLLLRAHDLEGTWHVATRAAGAPIGTATVLLNSDACSGRLRLRDAATLLHTKFRLVADPDPVECCGSQEAARAATPNPMLVVLDPEYESNGKFWRAARHAQGIEWTKTTAHVYDEALGWMREHDTADAEMGPSASVLWTR